MRTFLGAALVLSAGLLSPAAFADTTIDAVGTCLTDSTNGKDRKDLVKWIFVAVSNHPELSEMSSVTPADEEAVKQRLGQLFTRLISQDCPSEISAMVKMHGAASLSKPFEVLGAVAMRELMSDPKVAAGLSDLDRYIDQAKVSSVLQAK